MTLLKLRSGQTCKHVLVTSQEMSTELFIAVSIHNLILGSLEAVVSGMSTDKSLSHSLVIWLKA